LPLHLSAIGAMISTERHAPILDREPLPDLVDPFLGASNRACSARPEPSMIRLAAGSARDVAKPNRAARTDCGRGQTLRSLAEPRALRAAL